MSRGRLEAFSDGVIAIIITIMVLGLAPPRGAELAALLPLLPIFLSYALSFVFVGIYWNNHHHLLQAAKKVNGQVLWANLHFLFWLSLVPFATAWMGANGLAAWPLALYGVVLLGAGFAYFLLSQALIGLHGKESVLAIAVGDDRKGIISLVAYLVAISLAFFDGRISGVLYILVAVMWLIPDQRIEKRMKE